MENKKEWKEVVLEVSKCKDILEYDDKFNELLEEAYRAAINKDLFKKCNKKCVFEISDERFANTRSYYVYCTRHDVKSYMIADVEGIDQYVVGDDGELESAMFVTFYIYK